MNLTTIPTKASTTRDQLEHCIQRWHARLESLRCSPLWVIKLMSRRSAGLSAREPVFRYRSDATTTGSTTPVMSVGSTLETIARTPRTKSCKLTTKRRGRAFDLFLCLLVIWLLFPVLPLICHSLSIAYAKVAKRKRDEKILSPHSAFAFFFSVPLADQTVDGEEPRQRTSHNTAKKYLEPEDAQPLKRPARHIYNLSTDDTSSQPLMLIPSEPYSEIQENTWTPGEVSSRFYNQKFKLHSDQDTQDGIDRASVHYWPSRSLPPPTRPVQRHVNYFPRQTPALSPAPVSLRQPEGSDHAVGVQQASSPWHAFFQLRGSHTGPFQHAQEYSRVCSTAEKCKLLHTTGRGAHTPHIGQTVASPHIEALSGPPSPLFAQDGLQGKNVLPRHAPYVSTAFLGVDSDEDEEEDSAAEAREESKEARRKRSAVGGQGTKAEDEDHRSGQEDASEKEEEVKAAEEKEEEVEAAEEKEEKEEEEAEEEIEGKTKHEGAKEAKGKVAEEEEEVEEEGKGKHEAAKKKKHEEGKEEKSAAETEEKKEGVGKAEAQHPPTAHTLIKKKPPDYMPAWAIRKGEKTVPSVATPGGAPGLLTEKPLVLHSSLKPKAKIYFREHHKEETSKADGHKETPVKGSAHKAEKSGKKEEPSEKAHKEEAGEKRKGTEETHKEAEGKHKEAEEKHGTAEETHNEAREESGEKKGEHPGKPPPIVLQGQPVQAGLAAPVAVGIPVQTQEMVQQALASTPGAVPAAGHVPPVSPTTLPGAATLPIPGAAASPPLQLATIPTTVPSTAPVTPAGSDVVIPAGTPPTAAAAPAGATSPGLVAEAQPPTPATFPVINPAGGAVLPPSVPVIPERGTDATTAAAMQQAALSSGIAEAALREQIEKEILAAAAEKQKAIEEAKMQEWSAAGIALTVLLSLLLVGGVAGLVYYFYDKITRSVQRMRKKYAQALEERRRKRELRRQEEASKIEEPDIVTEDQE